jgi:hypothetical protein
MSFTTFNIHSKAIFLVIALLFFKNGTNYNFKTVHFPGRIGYKILQMFWIN